MRTFPKPGCAVRNALAAAVALAATMGALMPSANAAELPERATSAVVYGDDPCPKPADPDEIVVCARRPESDRYRIPKEFRKKKDERGAVAWAMRFDQLEEATRFTRPNSCSVVGAWGQTGCTEEMIRQWYAERRARKSATTP